MPCNNLFLGCPTMRAKSSFTRAAAACCAQASAAGTCGTCGKCGRIPENHGQRRNAKSHTTGGADSAGAAPLAWLLRKEFTNFTTFVGRNCLTFTTAPVIFTGVLGVQVTQVFQQKYSK